MRRQPEYLRLCRLLHESLHPFSELPADSLTEQVEKDLLIVLSRVFRQVKQWTHQADSDEEQLAEPVDDREISVAANSYLDNRHCLAKTIGDLIFVLSVNSRYAQHLAGNILVAISEFLLPSESGWIDFMHLLCVSLELAIHNSITSSSQSVALETIHTDRDPSTSRSLLKMKLKRANWLVVAAIFGVLHNMQKYILKQDFDDIKIVKSYLDYISSLMTNLPWDTLREIYVGQSTEAGKEVLLETEWREITVFFGNFIQFLSSLVTKISLLDDGVGFSTVIINLVPELTAWCNVELQGCGRARISYYFRHKVLMLMVKLSSSINLKPTIHTTWMHLIHNHFEDFLLQPLSGDKFHQDEFLEGSPFCTSVCDPQKQTMWSQSHLQRLTVFLFLKCSLNQSTGLVELLEWLKAQVPADILVNNELYFRRCLRFSLSFLQLFMHEDDILFEVLLLLSRAPFYLEHHQVIKDEALAKVTKSCNSLASELFNPVNLFHLFLFEIRYDHQVLLDYLISKDIGSSCAEYLLRSLRFVCNSWSIFVEFPGVEEGLGQLSPKRQKVVDCRNVNGVLVEEHNEGCTCGTKCSINSRPPFAAARDCLVSLRISINSLNKKKIFPYNPQVLLRRLMRFEELCSKG